MSASIVDAIADALLRQDEGGAGVGQCPHCGEVLIVADRHADHLPPLCPEWAQYMENWSPIPAPPAQGA